MANSDKDILITPNIGQTNEPKIEFIGADNNTVTMRVLDDGTLSWSGSAGELFSISDSLTGTLFSVNDISGVPSLEVNSNGTVTIAEFTGNVLVGTATDNGTDKLQVNGSINATDIVLSGNLTIGGTTTTVNTADLVITDNIIVLNNGETGAGVTLGTAGIEIERGTASNVNLLFDESTDEWKLTKDGTNYYNILNKSDTAYTGFTNYLRSDADDTASGVITFTDYVHMSGVGHALYFHTDASDRSLITVSEAANGSVGNETWYLGHGADNDIFWYSYSKADRVITLAQNGKIGIGTNEPAAQFEVSGNVSSNWAGRFENTNANGYGILGITAGTDAADKIFELRKGTSTTVMQVDGNGDVDFQGIDGGTNGLGNLQRISSAYFVNSEDDNISTTLSQTNGARLYYDHNWVGDQARFSNVFANDGGGFAYYGGDQVNWTAIYDSENTQYAAGTWRKIDIVTGTTADRALVITHTLNDPDNEDFQFSFEVDTITSGSVTLTGDRERGSVYINLDDSTTGGDTANEARIYGMYVDVDSSGDPDMLVGVQANVTSNMNLSGSTITNMWGGYFLAESDQAAGTIGSAIGVYGQTSIDNAGSGATNAWGLRGLVAQQADGGSVTSAYGVQGEVSPANTTAGNNITTAYGVNSLIDNNSTRSDAIGTGYLFYGSYTGPLPTNARGLWLPTNDVTHRIDGWLGIGANGVANTALNITGGSGITELVINSTDANPDIQFQENGTAKAAVMWNTTTNAMEFHSNDSGLTYNENTLVLETGGNVGVGTNNPAYTLDVNGISHTRSYFQKEYNGQEILLRAQDSGSQWSIYHTINDSQGNYNIMLGVDGAGQYANTGDGGAKVFLTGHTTPGFTSINAADTGTAGNAVLYNIGLGVDSATAAVYVNNPNNNVGLNTPSSGYKIASNSGQIFGTDILGNVGYTDGGQIALSRSNNNPYLSFHDASGNRDGYIQSISTTNMIIQHAGDIRLASATVRTDSDIQATGIAVDAVVTVENWSGGNNTVGSAHNLGTWSFSGGTLSTPGVNFYDVDIDGLPDGLGYQVWVGNGTSTLTSPTINLAKYRPMTDGSQYPADVNDAFSDAKLFLTCWVAVQSMDDAAEYMAIEVKSDANTTWTEKARLSEDNDTATTNVTDTTWHKMTIDITNFAETNFQVRFVGTGAGSGDGYGVSSIYIHQATLPSNLSLRQLTVNQKVGIGNDNPLQPLSISGRANADQNNDYYGAWFDGNTATNGYSYFAVGEWYNVSTYFQKKQGQSYSHLYTYDSGHSIAIQAGSNNNGETAASGNVGIGKTNPSTKLHVFEDNMVGPDPVVKVDASYLTDTTYNGHGSVMQLTSDRGDGFIDGYLLDVQNSDGTALKIRGDRVTVLTPGTTDYFGNQTGIVGKTLQIHTKYDTTGSQWNAFGHLNGNWLDGASGADSQYGLIYGFQNNVRGGLIYDHRSTERMALWSSYGRIDFLIADSADANGVPTDSNINEVMTILPGGNIGIGVTTPQKPLDVVSPQDGFVTGGARQMPVGSYSGIHFGYSEPTNSSYRKSAIVFERTDLTSNNAQGKIHILNGPQSGAGSATLADAKITIAENGNVGIGVTDPSSKFEVHGTAGQLFSVTDDLIGTIFAVNDVSGIPSIEVEDDGTVKLAEFGGNVLLGTGTDNGSDLLQVDGGILATGDVTAYGSSDARLKTNLEPIANAVDKVNTLTGYTFNWNEQAVGKDTTVREAGIIAQDVDAVLPEVVTTRKDGYMAVKYEKIVPLLIEAIKEQDDKIKRLEALVEKLLDEK